MRSYPNLGFASYWKLQRSRVNPMYHEKSIPEKALITLQTAFRLTGIILQDAAVELFFLLIFGIILTQMAQGRDIIVSLFEPDGIYSGMRVVYTLLAIVSLSVSMWMIPAFLFEHRDRVNIQTRGYRSIFREHLFFAHRVLPLIPFWLMAFSLFSVRGIAWAFIGFSIFQLVLLYLFNKFVEYEENKKWYQQKRIQYAFIVLGIFVVVVIAFVLNYRKTYTTAKVLLAIILYLMAFLIHIIYEYADRQIILEHLQGSGNSVSPFRKHKFNSWFYTVCLGLHIVVLVLLFQLDSLNLILIDRLDLAPDSIMLYIFSLYVVLIDAVVYLMHITPRRKAVFYFLLIGLAAALYFSKRFNLNVTHYSMDPIGDTLLMKGKQRLSFAARYAKLREKIEANPTGEPYPIVLIAGEGGGSRAGMWFSQNLINFDYCTKGAFREHIFSISTVSGSSVGVGTMCSFWEYCDRGEIDTSWLDLPSKVYENNFVGSSVSALMLTDLWKSVWPFPAKRDRNTTLQEEEAYFTRKAILGINEKLKLKKSLDTIAQNDWPLRRDFMNYFYSLQGDSLIFRDRPLVLINTCRSNDGRRGIFSPVKLTDDVFNDALDITGYLYENSIRDHGGRIRPTRWQPLSLGQACNTSELFPLFSAPAYIDSLGSFVDGGYHENSGLKTTLDVYLQLRMFLKQDSLLKKPYKIYIVYLKNGPGEKNLYKGFTSELPIKLPLKALTSQPFEGSTSFFEEKAKYADTTTFHGVPGSLLQFIPVYLDNKLLLDEQKQHLAATDENMRDIEAQILRDLKGDSDTVLNFPLARWLSRSVIKRIRLASFPVKRNPSFEDYMLSDLIETINKLHNVEGVILDPFKKWGPSAKEGLKKQVQRSGRYRLGG